MLTAAQVRAAEPRERPYKVADGGGLFLHVAPTGTKTFRLAFRFGGKAQLLVFGRAGDVSLADARARRDEARLDIRNNRNPAGVRRRAIAALTAVNDGIAFEPVARAWFTANAQRWSAEHATDVITSLERHVFPAIGAAPIISIGSPRILELLRAIEATGAIETARRVRQRISAVFARAIAEGLVAADPAAIVARALEVKPETRRQAALLDLDQLRAALAAVDAVADLEVVRLASQLLALTAVRSAVARGARWSEFQDLDGPAPLWRIPAARMKLTRARKRDAANDHLVPLSRQAVAVLRRAQHIGGATDMVFPGARRGRPIGENAIGAVYRAAGLQGRHSPHGWRAAFSTILNEIDPANRAADSDRGHVFTNAMLNMRGREETLIIGSLTMKPLVERLLPGANIISRPRLSKLSYAGERKIVRLPPRSAIVAFSAEEVYAIAELIRRQRGGAAVVMGALSPRTRNAQVELFQNGDVDHIVATDAIGMGLNLEIDHVAFAADRKFDGYHHRRLHPAEMAQIAGRAGRHLKDGTFGTSARCPAFEPELIEQLETHDFDAVRMINWRNPDLQFSSLKALQASLLVPPQEQGVTRAPTAADEMTLEIAATRPGIAALASTPEAVRRLWEVCALPDYRKVAPHHHADLAVTIYEYLMRSEFIPVDWFGAQVALCDRMEGEIDTLAGRLAQIRTWTFCANRIDWLRDPEHWQRVTRKVEDKLSDALHEKLAARFVDRRTSVLMRRLRENAMLEAEVNATGDVLVEGQHVGKLSGFRFTADTQGMGVDTPEAKALRAAAAKSLASEIESRAGKFAAADDASFALALDGTIRWLGEPVAKLQAGEKALEPKHLVLADEHLSGPARDQVDQRLGLWLAAHVQKYLAPLKVLEAGESLTGIGRGLGYQLAENLGVLERATVAGDVKSLDQAGRSELRKLGVRFGSYHIYTPQLLKPAARALAAQLWMLKHAGVEAKGLDDIVHLASSGRTSFPADEALPKGLYRAAGFRVCGPRAVRIDILERLADIIRPAIAFRPGVTPGQPPAGATEGDGFTVSVAMTSLVGCSGEDFAAILKSLGYRSEKKPKPEPKPIVPLPGSEPVVAAPVETQSGKAQVAPDGHEAAEAPTEGTTAEMAMSPPVEPALETLDAPLNDDLVAANTAVLGEMAETPVEAADVVPIPEPAPADFVPQATHQATDATVSEQSEPLPLADEPSAEATAPVASQPVADHADGSDHAIIDEDAPPVDAPGADAAAEPQAPVEPVMIEVWRPARFERDGQRNHQPRQKQGRNSENKPGRQLWVRDPNKPVAAVPADAAGEPAAKPEPRTLWVRDPSKPVGPPRRDRPEGGNRNGKTQHGKASFGKAEQGGFNKRQNDHRGGGDFRQGGPRPAGMQSAAPRAEKQADPDSPFAKLAALKAQLEGKS